MSAPNRTQSGQKRPHPLSSARTEPNLVETTPAKRARLDNMGAGAASMSQIGQPLHRNDLSFEDTLVEIDKKVPEQGMKAWRRPELPNINPNYQSIHFQLVDVKEGVVDSDTDEAVIWVFGVTERGNSVMALVKGMRPYLYIVQPKNYYEVDNDLFVDYLNELIGEIVVCSVDNVRSLSVEGTELSLLKITFLNTSGLIKIQNVLKRGACNYRGVFGTGPCQTYDTGLVLNQRFRIDTQIVDMDWLQVAAGCYTVVQHQSRVSTCQLEITVYIDDLISCKREGKWAMDAPIRVLSLDIECEFVKGRQPLPEVNDRTYQVSNVVAIYGQQQYFIRNVFTLGTCDPISGAQVISSDNEAQMLERWCNFITEVDPDIIIGYNSAGFDVPFLLKRIKRLNLEGLSLSRIKGHEAQVTMKHYRSKRSNRPDGFERENAPLLGRLQFDLMWFMHKEYRFDMFSDYALDNVASRFLNERKEEMNKEDITVFQNGTSQTRRRLAIYCLKDAYLPHLLVNKLSCLGNAFERARVSGVPFSLSIASVEEEATKVLIELCWKAKNKNCVVPDGKSKREYEGYLARLR